MDQRQFLCLGQIEALLNDDEFLQSIDYDSEIHLVQLPPDVVDQVSDAEEIDVNNLEDTMPHDVPGKVELHYNQVEPDSNEDDNLNLNEPNLVSNQPNGVSTDLLSVNQQNKKHDNDTNTSFIDNLNRPSTSQEDTKTNKEKTKEKTKKPIKNPKTKLNVACVSKPKPGKGNQSPSSKPKLKSSSSLNKNKSPKVTPKPKINKKKEKENQSTWSKSDPVFRVSPPSDDHQNNARKNIEDALKDKNPVEIFECIFDETICDHIVKESVTYATQNNRHSFTFSNECLKKFIGFLIFTGYHSLPQEQMYWSEDEDISIDCVRKCFSKNRFVEIKRNLHFNDNSKIPNTPNKSYKVEPLFEHLNSNFVKFGIFSKNLSIDEQMVRYYSHHFLKQFIRGKPIRFGFKQWLLCCGETGYCFHTELYEGKKTQQNDSATSVGSSVVMSKLSVTDTPENHVYYFDNFFTSFDLMKSLTENNVCATGTVRYNMMNSCPIKSDKEMKKEERGAIDYRFDEKTNVFAVTWKDNNNVKVLSNFEALEPQSVVTRWSKLGQEKVKVSQPRCITTYNKWMGGVDRMDWFINKYRIRIKAKRWYFPIFTNLIDMAVVNAHILSSLAGNKMPLLDFKRTIARTYLALSSISDPRNSGRPALPKPSKKRVLETVRFDPVGHFLERTSEGKQRKCGMCKTNVRKQCSKCNIGLHITCFQLWHKKQ